LKLGVRGRLFGLSFLLIAVALATGGVYLEVTLRSQLEARIEAELAHNARAGCVLLRTAAAPADPAAVDPLADALGRASAARVTIIAADGTVLGDSELDLAQVRAVENHGRRPEVLAARPGAPGSARRYSTTLDTDMLYVAVRCRGVLAHALIRAAKPLDEVDRAVSSLRLFLLIAAGLALGAAGLISALAAHLTARTLQRLVEHARALAEGRDARIPNARQDELGGLIGSLNKMAEALQHEVTSLAAERDRFEAVLEGMADGVLALDADGHITHANHTALQLLRLEQPPLGRSLVEIIRVPAFHEMMAGIQPGQPATVEFDLTGEPRRRLRASAARRRAGGGTVIVFQDVTDLRRLETIRQDFVANVSHELRTPVSVIRANAETLLGGALSDPERAREFVAALHRNAERLSSLVDDLLDVSRIDSGRIDLELGLVPVADAVAAVLGDLGPAAADKGLTIETELGDGLRVLADAEALSQVLSNLVDNAIKYTPSGGRIEIRARAQAEAIRVEVADDGAGISPRHRDRVFERFYRVDKGRSREMGGTGLGLSIVKNLIDSMDGLVGFEPNAPSGSVFWFSLPAA